MSWAVDGLRFGANSCSAASTGPRIAALLLRGTRSGVGGPPRRGCYRRKEKPRAPRPHGWRTAPSDEKGNRRATTSETASKDCSSRSLDRERPLRVWPYFEPVDLPSGTAIIVDASSDSGLEVVAWSWTGEVHEPSGMNLPAPSEDRIREPGQDESGSTEPHTRLANKKAKPGVLARPRARSTVDSSDIVGEHDVIAEAPAPPGKAPGSK
jgi:hypothetical protein